MKRRSFIDKMSLLPILGVSPKIKIDLSSNETPLFIATWDNINAVSQAYKSYNSHGKLLDSIVEGINYVENDPSDMSVGYGGRPDRKGDVTLDACVMDHNGKAGSVTCLKGIKNPVSVAKEVMETTPHVILTGKGAQEFAVSKGYEIEDLLTEKSTAEYKEWLKSEAYKPKINIENHDTIGMLGSDGVNLSGACSTSGLAYKLPGRVGDSPIIGAGLFVDNEIGACVATGLGEKVLTSCSSFLVVELMRQGFSIENACKRALKRILKNTTEKCDFQVALIAIDKNGNHGGYSLYDNFGYAASENGKLSFYSTKYFFKYEEN